MTPEMACPLLRVNANMFEVARFRLELRAREPITLPPYKGSTLRGGFGAAFKGVACALREKDCSRCLIRHTCVYSYVFETPPPADARMMRKYPYAPHPFVIEPPLEDKRKYLPDETLGFGLVLIGRAIDYLPYFVYTFEELGKRGIGKGKGRFTLKRVCSLGADGEERPVYDGTEKVLSGGFPRIALEDMDRPTSEVREICLSFLSPTRIKYRGRLLLDLNFEILIRNLLRRLSILSYFHCGQELELDFRGLIARASAVETLNRNLRWYDWERYSHRQGARMRLGGFVGEVAFRGDLTEFFPLLGFGEHVHLGKGTGFGLGQYRIQRGQHVC